MTAFGTELNEVDYETVEVNGKTYVICNFRLTPLAYLSEGDRKVLEENLSCQISNETKEKLMALCETLAAKNSLVWCFNAGWHIDCPVTNRTYLDPLFKEIKSRYPDKKLVINSEITTYKTKSCLRVLAKYCEEYGIDNAQVLIQDQNNTVKKITEGKNYIIIGDEAFHDRVKSMLKGECEWRYYPTQ